MVINTKSEQLQSYESWINPYSRNPWNFAAI